jgi:hypothetical protein
LTNADTTWTEHPVLGGKVKVWSQNRYPEDGPKAEEIADAVADTIWPQVTGLMGQDHAPLTDAPFPDNGGDGALDIYLVRLGAPGAGETVPYRKPSCRMEPAFINLDPTGPLGDGTHAGALQGLEHEFFHTVQFAYDLEGCWQDYRWFLEASAQWSEDYVYPDAQSEHSAAGDMLEEPWTPLDKEGGDSFMHEYGTYLFPFYLARGLGSPELIPSIWETYESTANSLQGVDTALQAHLGLRGVWPEFTLDNWNREPVDHYNDWDSLTTGAVRAGAGPVNISLSGESSRSFPVAAGVDYLAASYHHFIFDNSVRSIAFDNTLDGDPNAAVWALLKIGGEWREPADWTDEDSLTYCPDSDNERVEELVLIISNSDWQGKQPLNPDEQPRLVAGSFGCATWVGTVTNYWHMTGSGTNLSMSITATDVVFQLHPEGSSDDWWDYHAQSGTLNVTLDSGPGNDCDEHGSGTVSVDPNETGYLRVSNLLLTPEGAERTYTGNAMSNQTISYNWSCPDGRHGVDTWPIVGWFFTGDQLMGDDPAVLQGEHEYTASGWIERWTWDLHAEP